MTFRILSLDGGGIRGIMTARMLQKVEAKLGSPLTDHFDLIAGTSTGSIVAAALCLGKSAQEIYDIYAEDGMAIFPYSKLVSAQRLPLLMQYGLSAPKFSDEGLISVLKKHLGDTKLSELTPNPEAAMTSVKFLAPTYDTISRNPVVFKSWTHDRWYAQVPIWEVCASSASAPTYFPAHRILHGDQEYSLIDGGVCANNPAACALAEGIKLLRESTSESTGDIINQIKILSIGTGDPATPIPWEKVREWGLIQWGLRIADVFMDAPPDINRYITQQIMGGVESEREHRFLRLQFPLDQESMAIDDASKPKLAYLTQMTDDYLDEVQEKLDQLLEHW